MSRDGLVEENLRTGKKHKVVTGRVDAIRIGDRPMEVYGHSVEDETDASLTRDRRLDRHGLQETGTDLGGHMEGPEPQFHRTDDPDGSSRHKKKISQKKGASLHEAPSSFEGDLAGASDSEPLDLEGNLSGASDDETRTGRDHLSHEKYAGALRQERGVQPYGQEGTRTDGSSSFHNAGTRDELLQDSRKHRLQQRRYALNQRESSFQEEIYTEPDKGLSYTQDEKRSLQGAEGTETVLQNSTEPGKDTKEYDAEGSLSNESQRLQRIRGHPAGHAPASAGYMGGFHKKEPGNRNVDYEDTSSQRGSRLRETSAEINGLDDLREEVQSKRKKGRLNYGQGKARDPSRLSFDDGNGMVKGSGAGFSRRAAGAAAGAVTGTVGKAAGITGGIVHSKIAEASAEDENVGTQAAHHAEMAAEGSARTIASRNTRRSSRKAMASRRKSETSAAERLLFEEGEGKKAVNTAKTEAEKRASVKRFFRKQRQRKMLAAAKKEEKTVEKIFREQQSFVSKAASVVRDAIVRNSRTFLIIGIVGLMFFLVTASLGSCAALLQGAGHTMISTTYPSTDEDIYAVENRYRELEAGLNAQINRMQQTHPTYDEFRFQIDEITHNPYHLISYFTAKYGQFTYDQVKDELEEIFREQYTLTTSGERGVTITETRTVRPGESLGQVTTSGYCPCEICCGPYAGGTTASGVYPMADHTIAVDAYNPFVPMGTHVIMNGIEYVVEDTGTFDRFGVQFDVYYDDHQTALAHGHQTCEAYLAEGGGIDELELTITRTVDRMSVVLTNHDLDTVLQNRMTADEKVRYSLYNVTYGNRSYLFDLNNLPRYGNASRDYTIPPEALSDERFARMIAEAERHLGTPYVWGGYAPGGFDCSGFVCWVVNHCGNGWDIGRTTAEGIRQRCAYVSPEDARPGDIIFFEHTYDCAGASHVGIYVGDGMMIHCGEPVQYTSINSPYWQDHFMEFGRLP